MNTIHEVLKIYPNARLADRTFKYEYVNCWRLSSIYMPEISDQHRFYVVYLNQPKSKLPFGGGMGAWIIGFGLSPELAWSHAYENSLKEVMSALAD